MNSLTISISDVLIRQDNEGRYCLNDLHKAAGGEDKHRPTYWLKNQQTIDIQKEIEIDGKPSIITKQGLGTFAVKELVYSYAMWISAKFHLAVIRAYDALVTKTIPIYEPKTKQALPGCLTLDQQDCVKALISEKLESLPKHEQGKAARKYWGALCKKFGKDSYKEISSGNFTEVVSLLSRLDVQLPAIESPEPPKKDFDAAKHSLSRLREWARLSNHPDLMQEELNRLENCVNSAYAEMDEAIMKVETGLYYLKRWRNK